MRWMVFILGLFLSGCFSHYQSGYQGTPPLQATSLAQVNAMVGVQQPAAYKVGFMEGCDSGRLSAGDNSFLFKKDTDRFDTDDTYQQGWNDGFNRCISGERVSSSNSYYQTSFGYYYPSTFYSGVYYSSYGYGPGYSIGLGYYGYPRHVHHRNRYYTPWYGGHKHRGHDKGRHKSRGGKGGGHKH